MASPARTLRFIVPTITLALLLKPDAAGAQYRYLCTSVPDACTYTGPDAPYLKADVCYGSTTGIRLMSGGVCPTGSWPYFVDAGEVVDPITGEIAAYVPLDDACARPGICVEGPPPAGTQQFPICCLGNQSGAETCYNGIDCGGQLYLCWDGVSNDDGTVTCFEVEG